MGGGKTKCPGGIPFWEDGVRNLFGSRWVSYYACGHFITPAISLNSAMY